MWSNLGTQNFKYGLETHAQTVEIAQTDVDADLVMFLCPRQVVDWSQSSSLHTCCQCCHLGATYFRTDKLSALCWIIVDLAAAIAQILIF